ncbi:uncharacterized protein L969DRAFT_14991 [Mixia osmundae IAM 14324]|uniref:uncharacterized protein n=1 Tax=Mixia osmundae (strain CBS 9802 / IAM 14324 / JCM 22182 / KY 12970) TaxID=764103 RepID=UPI0004A55A43|nr:uncharacterized protein L969DRAFT_14991 [Mixia osmundae IAM 14324]KEI42790.1 hypothetical protein L969DRAFT_14991 [Mixia osmundae IAM 14324]
MQSALLNAPEPDPVLERSYTVRVAEGSIQAANSPAQIPASPPALLDSPTSLLPVLNKRPRLHHSTSGEDTYDDSSPESPKGSLFKRPTLNKLRTSSLSTYKVPVRPNARAALARIGQISAAPTATKELTFELARIDGGREALRFLVYAFIFEATTTGIGNSYGVMLDFYLQQPTFADSKGAGTILPLVGTTAASCLYIGGPILLAPLNRWPHRCKRLAIFGTIVYSAGLALASTCTKPWQLLITQGLITGLADALVYFTTFTWLTSYWVKRRDLAANISLAGAGVGGAVMPFVVHKLLDSYGYPTTLRALAVGTLVVRGSLLPFMHSRLRHVHQAAGRDPGVKLSAFDRIPHQNPLVWLCAFGSTVQSLSKFAIGLYLPAFANALGLSTEQGTILVMLNNLCATMGPLLVGLAVRKLNPHWVAITKTTVSSMIVLLLWGASSTYGVLVAFAVVIGITSSGYSGLYGAFADDITKTSNNGNTLWGMLTLARGVGNIIIGPISAALLRTEVPGLKWRGYGAHSPQAGHFGLLILFTGCTFIFVTLIHLFIIAISERVEGRNAGSPSTELTPVQLAAQDDGELKTQTPDEQQLTIPHQLPRHSADHSTHSAHTHHSRENVTELDMLDFA